MGKSAPTPPAAPDPMETAAAQATFSKEAALQSRALGMMEQITPQGTVSYEPTGGEVEGIPSYRVTQELSPEQQGLYDVSTRLAQQYGDIGETQLGAVRGTLEQPFSLEGLGAAPTVDEAARQQAMASILARQQPQMDVSRQRLQTELATQGFVPGTEAYDRAMDEQMRRETDLGLAADIAAGGEMERMYGLQSGARDRAINEMLMQRQQPLSELSTLMTGAQPGQQQFLPTAGGQVAPTDYMSAAYGSQAAQQRVYEQQAAQQRAETEGLYSLLGTGAQAAFMFSDRRLKRNIEKIGELANGLGVYLYHYLWGGPQQIGLMADEVKKLCPAAVISVDGFDAVNYAEAIKCR